jgi:methylmalonyl-CoA epimerase
MTEPGFLAGPGFSDRRLHHVGIVSPSLDAAAEFISLMGMVEIERGYVAPWTCWCIFVRTGGSTMLELVVPDGGPLARFNRGAGGVHHFAFEVADIAATSDDLRARGIALLEPHAIKGAGNFLCNFIHPIATRGVQIELVQPL